MKLAQLERVVGNQESTVVSRFPFCLPSVGVSSYLKFD